MRNINIVKYRKLLYKLQIFCKTNKSNLWRDIVLPKKSPLTDYERGYIAGQHSAYNKVLRETQSMITGAEYDWESVHCREEVQDNKQ